MCWRRLQVGSGLLTKLFLERVCLIFFVCFSTATPGKATPVKSSSVATPAPEPIPGEMTPRTKRRSSRLNAEGETGGNNEPEMVAQPQPGPSKPQQRKRRAATPGNLAPTGTTTTTPMMSFKTALETQAEFNNRFKFVNKDAVIRSIPFRGNEGITYLGCPVLVSDRKICGQRVIGDVDLVEYFLLSLGFN